MAKVAVTISVKPAWWVRHLLFPAAFPFVLLSALCGERGTQWALAVILMLAARGLRTTVADG
ncbi:hypothetical protein ACUSIJ_07595 [Pseudochelatococcus sp. B33]